MAFGLALLAACGGAADTADSGSDSPGARASLAIIDRDTSVRAAGTQSFREGTEGEGLAIGDTVQTSPTGFAEIAFFDGSLTRVDHSGQFTLNELTDAGATQRVAASLIGGRAWNRVAKAVGPADEFEIDTPVASATVRGTAFSIDCMVADTCTFTVVEGTVEITPMGGVPVSVTAPAELTVQTGTGPATPTPVDPSTFAADPWISRNISIDATNGLAAGTSSTSSSSTTGATTVPPSSGTSSSASSVDPGSFVAIGLLVVEQHFAVPPPLTPDMLACVGERLIDSLEGAPLAAAQLRSGERVNLTAQEVAKAADLLAACGIAASPTPAPTGSPQAGVGVS